VRNLPASYARMVVRRALRTGSRFPMTTWRLVRARQNAYSAERNNEIDVVVEIVAGTSNQGAQRQIKECTLVRVMLRSSRRKK
jgi:hypothetical protein